MAVILNDNTEEFIARYEEAVLRALERIGSQAEGYAKDLCPVDTGDLRNSIGHKVDESNKKVYIGTNKEYAPYVELGTGKYATGGRKDPWAYQDGNGNWHMTNGQRAQPFLKPAAAEHGRTYYNIVEDELKNG